MSCFSRGIPYAAPPTGPRRFRAPEPHDGWTGVRDARRFGPAAPQLREEGLTANRDVQWDEDCLTLNVCTPALDDARRPVLVWIHGGGFRTGQGAIPWYNGTSFAQRGDIVTVSLNYRLGALGFALPGGDRRCRLRRLRPQRDPRSDRRAALGARQHRRLRRRSTAGDHRGRVRRWHECRDASWLPRSGGALSRRHSAKRCGTQPTQQGGRYRAGPALRRSARRRFDR